MALTENLEYVAIICYFLLL